MTKTAEHKEHDVKPGVRAQRRDDMRRRLFRVASQLFAQSGFDATTYDDIARAAGVARQTVFNHFPRKEDLFLDRTADAVDLLRSAIRDRGPGVDVLASLRDTSFRLYDDRHPLSGVDERSAPFFRTVAESPALVARAREIASDLQRILSQELERDPSFEGDGALLAALFIAGYSSVMVETARRLIAGQAHDAVLDDHRARLERLFDALGGGFVTGR